MITTITGQCQYLDCTKPATQIASGRRDYQDKPTEGAYDVGLFCEDHAWRVASHNCPEYTTVCPNCGCEFGVN